MEPIYYVIPFFIVSMLVEWRLLVHRQREDAASGLIGYTGKDSAASLAMGLGMLGVNLVESGVKPSEPDFAIDSAMPLTKISM